jgi:hypothetical protein
MTGDKQMAKTGLMTIPQGQAPVRNAFCILERLLWRKTK